jgi:hypothetical protein
MDGVGYHFSIQAGQKGAMEEIDSFRYWVRRRRESLDLTQDQKQFGEQGQIAESTWPHAVDQNEGCHRSPAPLRQEYEPDPLAATPSAAPAASAPPHQGQRLFSPKSMAATMTPNAARPWMFKWWR